MTSQAGKTIFFNDDSRTKVASSLFKIEVIQVYIDGPLLINLAYKIYKVFMWTVINFVLLVTSSFFTYQIN
jgi:hypothetical protein